MTPIIVKCIASFVVILLVVSVSGHAATPDWNKQLAETIPLLGHCGYLLSTRHILCKLLPG